MNNDELLEKYFTGSMSNAESLEFKTKLDNDIRFASEFRKISDVESKLIASKTKLNKNDLAFLAMFGTNIISDLPKSGDLKDSRSFFNKYIKTKTAVVSSIVAVLLITSSIVFINYNSTENKANSPLIQKEPANNITYSKTEANADKVNQSVMNESDVKKEKKQNSQLANQNHNQPSSKSPVEKQLIADKSGNTKSSMKGTIDDFASVSKSPVQELESKLFEYQSTDDFYNTANTQRLLGIYSRNNNDFTKSLKYFKDALANSLKTSDKELQAEILGELGLLEIKRGNKTKGLESLEKCISILKSINAKKVLKWEKIFDKNK